MQREIIFRGKRKDNGEWIYGYYTTDQHGNHFIVDSSANSTEKTYPFFKIFSESVGQFTGLTDKNGDKIFEGDVLKRYKKDGSSYQKTEVVEMNIFGNDWVKNLSEKLVIGNLTDNPELLNTK